MSILRLKEIAGKTGFFLVGVLFARPVITRENFVVVCAFFGLCLLNGISVYLINAGFGYKLDSKNTRLVQLQNYKQSTVIVSGFLMLAFSLIGLYLFNSKLLLPALAVYFIWTIYSLPNGLKGIPVLGMICAFVAQVIHFHIGYFVFSSWTNESIWLSIYFALLFSAGHALHEVIDYEADKEAGIKTSAVYFGRRNLFYVSNLIFVVATLYFVILMVLNVLPLAWVMPYYFAFALQFWFLLDLRRGWSKDDLFRYRRKYMTAYLLATVAVMLMIYL